MKKGSVVHGVCSFSSSLYYGKPAAWADQGRRYCCWSSWNEANYSSCGNFILGALMTLGIGLYAPCMALVYFLGLSPLVAFPIMMGSCAYLMPAASVRFIKAGAYNRKATLMNILLGVPGVLVAAYLVTGLSIAALTKVVMAVVLYTAIKLVLDSRKASLVVAEL